MKGIRRPRRERRKQDNRIMHSMYCKKGKLCLGIRRSVGTVRMRREQERVKRRAISSEKKREIIT